mmetsp:Transcript_8954/g.19754  ORF Transcript_8954/g.19754 Transcript_8954/m.19754 type:complete len:421 (+) Transcript_8954:40-1302(+)
MAAKVSCKHCKAFGSSVWVLTEGNHHEQQCSLYRDCKCFSCKHCPASGTAEWVTTSGNHHGSRCPRRSRTRCGTCAHCEFVGGIELVTNVGSHHNESCPRYRESCLDLRSDRVVNGRLDEIIEGDDGCGRCSLWPWSFGCASVKVPVKAEAVKEEAVKEEAVDKDERDEMRRGSGAEQKIAIPEMKSVRFPAPAATPLASPLVSEQVSIGGFFIDPSLEKEGTFQGLRCIGEGKSLFDRVFLVGTENGDSFWSGSAMVKVTQPLTVVANLKDMATDSAEVRGVLEDGKLEWSDGKCWLRNSSRKGQILDRDMGTLSGMFIDPMHYVADDNDYAGVNLVSTSGNDVTIVGSVDGKRVRALSGILQAQDPVTFRVESGPQGGGQTTATYQDGQLKWADGTVWRQQSAKIAGEHADLATTAKA